MITNIYKKTLAVLMKRPLRLWGISLLQVVFFWLAYAGFGLIPAIPFASAVGVFMFSLCSFMV